MSNTQDKRKERNKERLEFLIARRNIQLDMFQQALAIGEKLYEDNKEKLSEDEIKQLEDMRASNSELFNKVKEEVVNLQAELDELNTSAQA